MVRRFKQFVRGSKAVSALEYAILIGVVATAIAVVLSQLGESIEETISKAKTKVDQARKDAGLQRN